MINLRTFCCLFFVSAAVTPLLTAQFSAGSTSIRGEVTEDGAIYPNNLMVELVDESTHTRLDRTPLHAPGTFHFENLKAGFYRIRVTTTAGEELQNEVVQAGGGDSLVSIRLAPEARPASEGGTVTLARLKHAPSGKVVKELQQSAKMMEKGEAEQAEAHILKAVELDPKFSGARRALGLLYVQMHEPGKAIGALEEAVKLDPADSLALVDLGTMYLQTGRLDEAERTARLAVGADRSMRKARFLLGMSLVRQRRLPEEAIRELRQAQSEYPAAQLGLAECLLNQGNVPAAREELKSYLSNKTAPQREAASVWLSRLSSSK